MKKYLIPLAFLFISFLSFAQPKTTAALSEGAALLFKNTKSKLRNAEKNWFFKQLGFTLSKDKKQYMSGEFDAAITTYITDMNKDGIEEVFFSMQSSAIYGMVGENFSLFLKKKDCTYEMQQELGGGIAMILSTANLGYPDIAIGGPGFNFPAYRWDGKKYKFYKNIKDADLQNKKVKYMDLLECSKLYTDTLK